MRLLETTQPQNSATAALIGPINNAIDVTPVSLREHLSFPAMYDSQVRCDTVERALALQLRRLRDPAAGPPGPVTWPL